MISAGYPRPPWRTCLSWWLKTSWWSWSLGAAPFLCLELGERWLSLKEVPYDFYQFLFETLEHARNWPLFGCLLNLLTTSLVFFSTQGHYTISSIVGEEYCPKGVFFEISNLQISRSWGLNQCDSTRFAQRDGI